MDSDLKQLLKENGLHVHFMPTHGKGFYIETPKVIPDQIILNDKLSSSEVKKVIYHEIGHKLNDNSIPGSYKDDYLTHIKCEDCANDIKIKFMIADYAALGYDITTSNYIDIAHAIGTNDYDKVKKELKKYS